MIMPPRFAEGTDILHTWDRQEKETQRAYEAFRLYLGTDGKPGIRSIVALAEVIGCRAQNINLWINRYEWRKRAADYDAWNNAREEEAREFAARAAVKRVAEKWADHRIEFLDRYMKSHLAMLGKVEQMLEYPIFDVSEETEWYEDGRACKVTVVNPARWRARDMALISRSLVTTLREIMDMMEGPAAAARIAAEEDMEPDEAAAAIRAILDARARKAGVPGPAEAS
jgi:hypothetical protein